MNAKHLIWILLLIVLATACNNDTDTELKPTVGALSIVRVTEEISQASTPTSTAIATATIQAQSGQGNGGNNNTQSNFEAEWAEFLKTCIVRTDWTLTYVVQRGDTLVGIASKLGMDAVQLARGNCLKDPSLLTVGQVIKIPGAPTSTPLPSPSYTPTAAMVVDFHASGTGILAGYSYEVFWSVPENASSSIYLRRERRFNGQAATAMPPEDFAMLPHTGSMMFTANKDTYQEHLILTVFSLSGQQYIYTVDVTVMPDTRPVKVCDPPFFFVETGKEYIYSGGGILNNHIFNLCPSGAAATTNTIMQNFQNGSMIYRADTNEVYILPYTGLAGIVPNTYTEGEILTFPAEPPSGLLKPEGILGKAYIQAYDMASFLGWASEAATSYTMTYQNTNELIESWQGGTVMTFSFGGRFFLSHAEFGGTPPVWAYINATN
jgi:LysM repeat protein